MLTQTTAEPVELASLKAAITPDYHSRSAYTGRIRQTEQVTIINDDGTCYEHEIAFTVSWDSILKILALINKRAGT